MSRYPSRDVERFDQQFAETPEERRRRLRARLSSRPETYDVLAVSIKTGASRPMERGLTKENADAYIQMAIARRGLDDEFYKAVPSSTSSEVPK